MWPLPAPLIQWPHKRGPHSPLWTPAHVLARSSSPRRLCLWERAVLSCSMPPSMWLGQALWSCSWPVSPGTSEGQRGHFLPSRSPAELNVGVSVLGGEGEAEGLVRVNAASHGDDSEDRQGRALLGRWLLRPMAPRGIQALSLLTDLGLVQGEGGHPDLKTEHSVHRRPCALSGDWFCLMRLEGYLPAWRVSFCERFLASKRGLGMLLWIYCSHPAPSLTGGAGPVSW